MKLYKPTHTTSLTHTTYLKVTYSYICKFAFASNCIDPNPHNSISTSYESDTPYLTSKMHFSTALLPLTLLVSYAAAQTSAAAAPTAAATGATTGNCQGQNVLEACLSSTTAIANACQSTDYTCLCTSWDAVLTYVSLTPFLDPSIPHPSSISLLTLPSIPLPLKPSTNLQFPP